MEAYIYDHVRTPRGKGRPDGALHEISSVELATQLLKALQSRNNLDTALLDDVIIGMAQPVGEQGGVLARAAVLQAGYAQTVAGQQIHRFCATGLDAVSLIAAQVHAGMIDAGIGGGVESMSRTVMGYDSGAWTSDPAVAFSNYYAPQGIGADIIATLDGYTREDVDGFAVESQRKAAHAWDQGYFKRSGLKPRGRIRSYANIGSEPTIMLTAPTAVSRKALKAGGMTEKDIDLWELNEAFASVVMRFQRDLDIPDDQINVNGGAIAMGHPLGATGAMILGTVLDELERRDAATGLITLCAANGLGTAAIIERV